MSRFSYVRAALALVVGCSWMTLVASGCGGDEDGDLVTTAEVQSLFSNRCATSGCHDQARPEHMLDLSANGTSLRDRLVGVESGQVAKDLVVPGSPGESYLYDKVLGTMLGVGLSQMPLGGPPLSDSEIALIFDWIINGAPDF